MNDTKISAPREVVEVVTAENFNLVWAYIDWAIKAGRFQLTHEYKREFRAIPQELKEEDGPSLGLLNDWMASYLQPKERLRVFSDIRRAQFEAAKGAVQIMISEETREMLRARREALYGEGRGSMEVTIRHLLEAEQRSLPLQGFRLLESFQKRNNLPTLSDTVRALLDHVELTSKVVVEGAKPLRREILALLEELKEGR